MLLGISYEAGRRGSRGSPSTWRSFKGPSRRWTLLCEKKLFPMAFPPVRFDANSGIAVNVFGDAGFARRIKVFRSSVMGKLVFIFRTVEHQIRVHELYNTKLTAHCVVNTDLDFNSNFAKLLPEQFLPHSIRSELRCLAVPPR